MKNIHFFFLIGWFIVLSCNDIMKLKPLDMIDENDVWVDVNLIETYLNDMYARFPSFAFIDTYQYTDEATTSGPNINSVTTGSLNRESEPGALGYWDYPLIRDINVFLKNTKESPALSANEKRKYEGQGRAIRAYIYFELAKRYGGVPLIKEVIDPFGEINDDLLVRRNENDIYKYVDKELEEAAILMDDDIDVDNKEKLNKWSILALKSRVDLWAASIAEFGHTQLNGLLGVEESQADDYYKKAFSAALEVANSNNYSLYNRDADKSKNYQDVFLNERNEEIIFNKAYDGIQVSHDWDYWKAPNDFASGQGSRCNPTLEFILHFEEINGGRINYNSLFNERNLYSDGMDIFKNKDPRLFATVLFQGSLFKDENIQMYEGIDTGTVPNPINIVSSPTQSYKGFSQVGIDSRLTIGDDRNTNSGFLVRKFLDEPNLPIPAATSQVDWPIIRLAEVYLNLAESAFMLGKLDSSSLYLNKVRDRAEISMVVPEDLSLDFIQNEWAVEFSLENRRWWDMRRWRISEDILNSQLHGLRTIWHFASNSYYFLPLDCEPFQRVFREVNYYNPFSIDKINNNPLIIQNPGY